MDIDIIKSQGNQASVLLAENVGIDAVKQQGNQAAVMLPDLMANNQNNDWEGIFPLTFIDHNNVVDILVTEQLGSPVPYSQGILVVNEPNILGNCSIVTSQGITIYDSYTAVAGTIFGMVYAYLSTIVEEGDPTEDMIFEFMEQFIPQKYLDTLRLLVTTKRQVLDNTQDMAVALNITYSKDTVPSVMETRLGACNIISADMLNRPWAQEMLYPARSVWPDTNTREVPVPGKDINLPDGGVLHYELEGFIRPVICDNLLTEVYNNTIAKIPASKARSITAIPRIHNLRQIKELLKK